MSRRYHRHNNRGYHNQGYYGDYGRFNIFSPIMNVISLVRAIISILITLAIVLIIILILIAIFKGIDTAYSILLTLVQYATYVLTYGPIILLVIGILFALYFIIATIINIIERINEVRYKGAKAKIERAKAKQEIVQYKRDDLVYQQERSGNYPIRTNVEKYYENRQREQYRQQEEYENEDEKQEDVTYYYRDISKQLEKGQMIIGVREDGSVRIGEWSEYKVVLVLGGSSSGKTTTMTQFCLLAIKTGGRLIVCDPHGLKTDGLLNKIAPLAFACYKDTQFAISHEDILHNLLTVKKELNKRVNGSDCSIPVFLILEEMNRLQRDKSISTLLTEVLIMIGQEGRGFNVYAVIGCQQISHYAGIRKSVIAFIIHRVDTSEASLCIPARYAKFASELAVGQTYVKNVDGMTELLKQVLVLPSDIQAIVAKYAKATKPLQDRRATSSQSIIQQKKTTRNLQVNNVQRKFDTNGVETRKNDINTSSTSKYNAVTEPLNRSKSATWGIEEDNSMDDISNLFDKNEESFIQPIKPSLSLPSVKQTKNETEELNTSKHTTSDMQNKLARYVVKNQKIKKD